LIGPYSGFSPRRTGFNSTALYAKFVADKYKFGQSSFRDAYYSLSMIILSVIYIRLSLSVRCAIDHLRGLHNRFEDNIKTGCKDVQCTQLVRNHLQWRALVTMVIWISRSIKGWEFVVYLIDYWLLKDSAPGWKTGAPLLAVALWLSFLLPCPDWLWALCSSVLRNKAPGVWKQLLMVDRMLWLKDSFYLNRKNTLRA
jgi:hypothetical protein